MRKINKDFDTIPHLLIKKGTAKKKGSLLQIQDAINTQKGSKYSSYQNVYEELKTLYNNKCAYCEEKVIKESELRSGEISERKKDATIDHYRPKDAGYYWLGNEWSNLLFACAPCNESIKKTQFPIEVMKAVLPAHINLFDSAGNFNTNLFSDTSSTFRADKDFLLAEKPLLLHPEIDNPAEHLTFDSWGSIKYLTDRGQKTIEVLKLDRFDDERNAIIGDIIVLIEGFHQELFNKETTIEKYNKDLKNLFCTKILLRQSIKKAFSFWYQYLAANFDTCILAVLEKECYFTVSEISHINAIFEECKKVVNTKLSHYE